MVTPDQAQCSMGFGDPHNGIFIASILLSNCYSLLAILQQKKDTYVEDEPRRNYRLEDFLWSGSGDGQGSGDRDSTWTTTTIFRTTTILTTIYPTPVFPTMCAGDECYISPTPTLELPQATSTPPPWVPPPQEPNYQDPPDQRYWLITVLETNATNFDLSPSVFEQRLARLYRTAFHRQQERHLKLNVHNEEKKSRRERRETVSVRVHRLNRRNDNGILELVYSVKVAGKPVDATVASEDMNLVADYEVTSLLGFPVLKKAEPYLKKPETLDGSQLRNFWLIGASTTAVLLVLGIIVLVLFFIGKKKRKNTSAKSRTSILQRDQISGTDNMGFKDDDETDKASKTRDSTDARNSTVVERIRNGTTPRPQPRFRPLNYRPASPNSYLSMPSVKAFPRGAEKPGPLEEVLDTDIPTESGVLCRHSSETADPGVVGPLVWDLHCHRLSKRDPCDEMPEPEPSVGRMRRRFHELLDDAFSLFGSGSTTPDEETSNSAHTYGRAKSAVVLPVDPLSSEKILRPKTTDAIRPATAGFSRIPPRGAWGGTSSPPTPPHGRALTRPLSAGPFHTPVLEPAWILTDSTLKPTDPAVPLIKAIRSELQKFPCTMSESYRS